MSVSRPHASAFVAGNDAPLIDERAANARAHRNGRCDEPPGEPKHTANRVFSDLRFMSHYATEASKCGVPAAAEACRPERMTHPPWRPPASHTVASAANDATRDAHARRRPATRRGTIHAEWWHVGMALLELNWPRLDVRFASARGHLRRPPTTRCSSANAPQPAGTSRRKMALSTPLFHHGTHAANDATRDAHARRRPSVPAPGLGRLSRRPTTRRSSADAPKRAGASERSPSGPPAFRSLLRARCRLAAVINARDRRTLPRLPFRYTWPSRDLAN